MAYAADPTPTKSLKKGDSRLSVQIEVPRPCTLIALVITVLDVNREGRVGRKPPLRFRDKRW